MLRGALIWAALLIAISAPLLAAAFSPQLAWRDPIYVAAGFAGIIGMALMLVQPLLVVGALPGITLSRSRRAHRLVGFALVIAVAAHVIGLWITSPPDVVDVLLFRSPTPFAIWGALAMWAVFAAVTLAILRARLPLRVWRWGHTVAVTAAVIGTVVHAVQILGTMEVITKTLLSILVITALSYAIIKRRIWVSSLF